MFRRFGKLTPRNSGRFGSMSPERVLSSESCRSSETPSQDKQSYSGVRSMRVARGKRTSLAAGLVDSSNLRFDSDDEGDDGDGEPPTGKKTCRKPVHIRDENDDMASEASNESDSYSESSSLHQEFEPDQNPEEPPYYRVAATLLEKILGPPPPDTDDLVAANKALVERSINDLLSRQRLIVQRKTMVVKLRLPHGTIDKNASFNPSRAGFLDLPGELRNKIYFQAFKNLGKVDFKGRVGFSHSSALLRVSKVVYNEARSVLYGENRFLFIPSTSRQGQYFEEHWNEINYSNIRKFFTDIGPTNIGLITNLGISFEDATPSGNPGTSMDDRRFENNKHVYWILKQLGHHGRLEKLKLSFEGRRCLQLHKSNAAFIHALVAIKTDTLAFGKVVNDVNDDCRYDKYHTKLSSDLKDRLKALMVRPQPLVEPKELKSSPIKRKCPIHGNFCGCCCHNGPHGP